MKKEDVYCDSCGAKVKEYIHSLTNGLVATLKRFSLVIKRSNKNDIHITKEGGFTLNQVCNFQKLKYFGLVSGESNKSGHWSITKDGILFLRAEKRIPKQVTTYRGKPIKDSDNTVSINDFPDNSDIYYEKDFNFNIHGTN